MHRQPKTWLKQKRKNNAAAAKHGICPVLAIILLVPFAIAGAYISTLSKKMKSVAEAVVADTYVSDALQLTRENDRFTYTTTTRRKKEDNAKTSRSSSGGGSGTSGKF